MMSEIASYPLPYPLTVPITVSIRITLTLLPSAMPAAIAITFLTAPPISTPTTSREVKTRKVSHPKSSATWFANLSFSLATTTAVARPVAISLAKDGPLKKAYSRCGPISSLRMSCIKASDPVSIPLEVQMIGHVSGSTLRMSRKYWREYWTGTGVCRVFAAESTPARPHAWFAVHNAK